MSEEKRQQIIALGRLSWSLRRIENETGIRRERASGYLKAAGLVLRPQGRRGFGVDSARIGAPGEPLTTPETAATAAKPANEVSTDFGVEPAAVEVPDAKPAKEPSPTQHPVAVLPPASASTPRFHRTLAEQRPQRQGHLLGPRR